MDESKKYLYRAMVNAARSGRPNSAALFEMCAAGWLPESNDRMGRIIENPFFGLSASWPEGSGLYDAHFVDALGEDIPSISHRVHPFDTNTLRWRCADRGKNAPIPSSVVGRAWLVRPYDSAFDGVDPSDEILKAAVDEYFPNWRIIGRAYFEPESKTSPT